VNDERDSSTYKFEGDFDNDKLLEVERLANEFIASDYEIKRYEDKEKAGFWWWEAGDIKMPCGGTHPINTGEIGKILVTLDSNKKGKIKIRTAFA
jgi:Ser-tRNA(Ala) deacylase AlaX